MTPLKRGWECVTPSVEGDRALDLHKHRHKQSEGGWALCDIGDPWTGWKLWEQKKSMISELSNVSFGRRGEASLMMESGDVERLWWDASPLP